MVKPITNSIIVICLCLFVCSCQGKTNKTEEKAAQNKPVTLTTDKDKISYVIGNNIASSLAAIEDELDPEIVKKGLDDKLSGKPLLIDPKETKEVLQAFTKKMKAKKKQERQAKAESNLAEGRAFLEENAKKDGVITTKSGLQYTIIKKGEGPVPTENDNVEVNYEGSTIDGKVFDSSFKRGKPITLPIKNMIPGWVEALQMMPVGSKYKLFIPSDLGYGEHGAGPQIPPNAVLIFDVELLDIVKPDEEAKPKEIQKPEAKQQVHEETKPTETTKADQ